MQKIIGIVLVLVVLGILLPIALVYIGNFGNTEVTLANGTTVVTSDVVDPTLITLVTILLPIMVVIGLVMYFIPKSKE